MSKTRAKKTTEVTRLAERLARSKAVVFASQKGVTVRDIEKLRRDLRAEQAEFLAIKRTLLRRAFADAGVSVELPTHDGTTSLAFSYGDEVAAARLVASFAKNHEGMVIMGGLLEKEVITAEKVHALAALPGKHELLGQFVRVLQGPVSGFVNVLAANLRALPNVLQALKESKS